MMHIALTIASNFVRYCAVTIVSILENNDPKDIMLHIVSEMCIRDSAYVGYDSCHRSFTQLEQDTLLPVLLNSHQQLAEVVVTGEYTSSPLVLSLIHILPAEISTVGSDILHIPDG